MRELSTQAANDTNTTTDREEIQKEMNQLTSEINRIGNTTEFNTQKLLNGGATEGTPATGTAQIGGIDITINGEATSSDVTVKFAAGIADTNIAAAWNGSEVTITIGTNVTNITADDLNSALGGATGEKPDGSNITFSYAGQVSSQSDFGSETISVSGGAAANNGSTGFNAKLQIGANLGQSFNISISDMRSLALGVSGTTTSASGTGVTNAAYVSATDSNNNSNELTDLSATGRPEYALDVTSHDTASAAIKVIDNAIESVSSERSRLGAYQNRLDHTINNLSTSSENLTAAESRIRDVDYALVA